MARKLLHSQQQIPAEGRLLRVVRTRQLEQHHAAVRELAAREANVEDPAIVHNKCYVGSARDLRGIPALARGVGGAIVGTVPHQRY